MYSEKKVYRFQAAVTKLEERMGGSHCLTFPWDVLEEFGTQSSVRVLGTINDLQIDRALIPRGDGTHYLLLSNELMKKIGVRLGYQCTVAIWKNENPDAIALPEELEEGFDLEPDARAAFERQTPGTQRGICYWVNSAKRPETRAKRAADMMERSLSGHFTLGNRKGKE